VSSAVWYNGNRTGYCHAAKPKCKLYTAYSQIQPSQNYIITNTFQDNKKLQKILHDKYVGSQRKNCKKGKILINSFFLSRFWEKSL
jgi:hypothetical protein